MRKTRQPQTVRKVLGRIVLVQAIKFAVLWLLSKAVLRSIERTNEKDYRNYGLRMDRQRIEDENRLKEAGRVKTQCASHPCYEDVPLCPDQVGSTGDRYCIFHCAHSHAFVDGRLVG